MAKNRAEAQALIIKYIDKLIPDGKNKAMYEQLFSKMSDTAFDVFMKKLESGEHSLAIIAPNFAKIGLTVSRNLEIAQELKHNFFERIWIHGVGDEPTYLTPIPYMVVDLPVNRQGQLLIKKISVAEDNKAVDDRTGQPTGRSKGASISYNETQVLAALGLDTVLEEFLKYRGGDLKGNYAMNNSVSKTGGVSLKGFSLS